MKLATFETHGGAAALGLVRGDSLLDLSNAAGDAGLRDERRAWLASMQSLIEAGAGGLDLAAELGERLADRDVPLADVRLLAPLPIPMQIRDCLCFEGHLTGLAEHYMRTTGAREPAPRQKSMRETFLKRPIYYKANRFAVVGPDTDIEWPPYSHTIDYELEMACIIGTRGKNISREEAGSHIFGYTIFNDFSARDTQGAEMPGFLGPAKSKDFDGANAMGPWIVTADEFHPANAKMSSRINGKLISEGSSSGMTYRFEDLIAFISVSETLHAGEILGSGTVGGGCGHEHGIYLAEGDEIELEIEGIGKLKNRVVR